MSIARTSAVSIALLVVGIALAPVANGQMFQDGSKDATVIKRSNEL